MATDIDKEFMGGAPAVTWGKDQSKMGRWVIGKVLSEMEKSQQRVYKTNELKFWEDGRPAIQYITTLATTTEKDSDDPTDDGVRRLFIKGDLIRAIRAALREAGAPGLEVGGDLAVRWISEDEDSGQRGYEAKFKRPAVSFEEDNPFEAPTSKPNARAAADVGPTAGLTTDLREPARTYVPAQQQFEDEPPF